MDDQELTPQKKERADVISKTLKMIALPVSAVAGLFYGHTSVRNMSYDNLKGLGAFKVGLDTRNEAARKILPEWGASKDVVDELKALGHEYSGKVDKRLAEMGYSSMSKRFKSLHRNQKFEAGLYAFTAAGVALGVILTIADHKNLFGLLSDKDKSDDHNVSK